MKASIRAYFGVFCAVFALGFSTSTQSAQLKILVVVSKRAHDISGAQDLFTQIRDGVSSNLVSAGPRWSRRCSLLSTGRSRAI